MITVRGLAKRFNGRRVLDAVTLEVPTGSICALLGASGAGKTTALRCMLGFLSHEGEVLFDGSPLAAKTFSTLAYVPDAPSVIPWMTVAEHLELGVRSHPAFDRRYAEELCDAFALPRRTKARSLAKGQRVGLSIVFALASHPTALLLDEPTSGLDPAMQRVFLDLMIGSVSDGASVLISTHRISDIEYAADRVAILNAGRLTLDEELEIVKARGKTVLATFRGPLPALELEPTISCVREGSTLRIRGSADPDALATVLSDLGAHTVHVVDQGLGATLAGAFGYGGRD